MASKMEWLDDKDIAEILKIFSDNSVMIFCQNCVFVFNFKFLPIINLKKYREVLQ